MLNWWNGLNLLTQIFYCVAIPASLVLVIQTVLMFIGFGDDADASDVDAADADLPEGVWGENAAGDSPDGWGFSDLRIFTVRGFVAFFVVFGWVGVVMSEAQIPTAITVPVAVVCGFLMMVVLALLMRGVMSLRNDGNTDNRNAIGTSGKVQLTIPPARSGSGKVHLMLQGTYVEREAVTDDEAPIPTGSEIVVVGISGQTDLVVRRK